MQRPLYRRVRVFCSLVSFLLSLSMLVFPHTWEPMHRHGTILCGIIAFLFALYTAPPFMTRRRQQH
jgi:hypothetical protein